MSHPKSTHIPGLAGEIVTVTGTLVVDTGLRNLVAFSVTMAEAASAGSAGAYGILTQAVGGQAAKLTLEVREDDGTTISSAATAVSWMAFGE